MYFVFCILILAAPFKAVCAQQDVTEERSGNQNKEYLKDAIPTGDALREALLMAAKADEYIKIILLKTDILIKTANELSKTAESCKNISECKAACVEQKSGQTCVCLANEATPARLCDMQQAEKIFAKYQENSNNMRISLQDLAQFIGKPEPVTEDIKTLKGVKFANLPEHSLYTSYRTFYNDYNRILAPRLSKLGVSNAFLPSQPDTLAPRIEYIKRKADLSRLQLNICNTPTVTEKDAENIDKGEIDFKEPFRIDSLIQLNSRLPDNPLNPLDYFCISYQNI